MSAFNPYSHWLGLAGKEKPDTYYELLGLKHGEKSVAKIAERAEALAAQVQKMGPEGHFPEWNQMLTEIQVAKNCLCNPKYKTEYDAKHPASSAAFPSGMASPFGAVGGPLPPIPAQPEAQPQQVQPQQPQQPQQPGMMGMQPGMMGGQPGMQPGMMGMQPGMQPGMMGMQPGMQPGMMGMQPGMMGMQPGMQPGMMGMQPGMQPGMMGMQPGMQPGMMGMQPGMQPGMMGMQPGMQNMYGGVMYPQQGMVQPAQVVPQPAVQPVQPVAVVPTVAPMASAPLSGTAAPVGNSVGNAPVFGDSSSSFTSSAPKSPARPSGKGYNKSSSKNSGPSPMVRNIIAIVGLLIVVYLAYAVVQKFGGNPEAGIAQVSTDGTVVSEFPNPSGAPDGQSEPQIGDAPLGEDGPPEAVTTFQTPDFEGILRCLGEHNFEAARSLFGAARAMKVSEQSEKRLNRIELLLYYSEEFQKRSKSLLQSMVPPMELCEGEYGLVESDEKHALLHINGENVRFTFEAPTRQGFNLFDILYRHKFRALVESGNMTPALEYACYELVVPNGNRELGLNLLNKVQVQGSDKDRETVQLILEELGVNGLGSMTNQVVEQRSPADAGEKEAEPATDSETEVKSEEEKAEVEKKADDSKEEKDSNAEEKKSSKKRKKASAAKDSEEAEAEAAKEKAAREQERHQNEWKQMATDVRLEIGSRRIAAARKGLNQLEKIAETDEEKHELDRLIALTNYMEAFVSWVGGHMGRFTPGGMEKMEGIDIGIVESSPGRLMVRNAGVNQTLTVENLNPALVEWLVGKMMKEPDDYVMYGTYLAMDPEGDREKARAFWSTAVSKGFSKDSIDLIMEELEVPLVDSGRRPSVQSARGPRGRNQPAQTEVQTIPVGEEHESALAKLKKEFAKDYANDDMGGQSRLAKKFLKMAQSPDRPAAEAYVMLEEAVRMATKFSFFETAYEAFMVQESRFGRDTYQDRVAMINDANPAARGQSSANELADCAIRMGMDAVQRKKKIEANQMLNIAKSNAKGVQFQKVKDLERAITTMK